MMIPLQITFKDVPHSDAVETFVREKAEKLYRFADKILRCHVVIESPHRHHQGNTFHVTVQMHIPGEEIVTNRDPGKNFAHKDIYVALRDAFDAARRQLQDHVRIRRRFVKKHADSASMRGECKRSRCQV
ncbi:MAG: hypothetical protein A3I05_08540 [Deltaproteobacteria bacterium RIFCSPLOWO2_02_FULL_44_10]|nr:MAG: hypothetical protein A3C46_05585 [Deltaproteobacteria bacterium RIFCSPHIGHO2_02_FULL_44_16]OGQ45544.1 MAG: hypothetical protein A3I05_08540 [Deltaproteobacteria bacterium RIFCSPLOWO2_02_FULL_44_10]